LPLNTLRTFEAVASAQTFKQAADHLQVSQAAVSQAIRALESYCGSRLFTRDGGRATLTDAGRAFYERIRPALMEVSAAFEELRLPEGRRLIKLTVLPSFMGKWLLPRLHDFFARYPGTDLQVLTERRSLDLMLNKLDAAIRFGGGTWKGLDANKMLDEWMIPVSSPAFKAATARALLKYPLVQAHTFPWQRWFADQKVEFEPARAPLMLDDPSHVVEAAVHGLGVGLCRWTLIQDDLRTKRLIRVHEYSAREPFSYYFVRPTVSGQADASVQNLHEWLSQQARAFPVP
jgi:LysR family transcriptional regulator, glycine cleavage system transcriptional activator